MYCTDVERINVIIANLRGLSNGKDRWCPIANGLSIFRLKSTKPTERTNVIIANLRGLSNEKTPTSPAMGILSIYFERGG